jgi:pimeloyl-ACP methyl ester carboxylesterase
VWNATPSALWLVLDPALLLPWLPLTPGSLVHVYDDFLSFLANQGYTTAQQNLYLFPYDWRQGLQNCAIALASFLQTQVAPNLAGRKILLISHSYGCMVVRWAILLLPPTLSTINDLIKGVVAAGPPMLGIPSAFKNLVAPPDAGNLLNSVVQMAQLLMPALASEILLAIRRCLPGVTAQVECMPTYPILTGGTFSGPPPYSAFDWAGWPSELDTLKTAVQLDLATLSTTAWGNISMTVFMSKTSPTDTGYLLDPNDQFLSALPSGPGDGVVPASSANAFCSPGAALVNNLTYSHQALLDDPLGRNYLIGNNII